MVLPANLYQMQRYVHYLLKSHQKHFVSCRQLYQWQRMLYDTPQIMQRRPKINRERVEGLQRLSTIKCNHQAGMAQNLR